MFIRKVQNWMIWVVVVVINFYILINITNFPPIMRSRGTGQLTAVQLSTVIVKRQYGANTVSCCLCYSEFFNDLKPIGQYMYRTVVNICTAQRSIYVPHSGHYTYRTAVTLCTAQWSLYVPHSGHYMYHQFNIHNSTFCSHSCIYLFCVDLRTNMDYFPIQH
jgi:hypothetical protein